VGVAGVAGVAAAAAAAAAGVVARVEAPAPVAAPKRMSIAAALRPPAAELSSRSRPPTTPREARVDRSFG